MSETAYSTEGFTAHEASVNGIAHIWWEIGEGSPCVYFHGGGTYHGFEWARDWAGHFRMILPHHPNFGESGDADFNSIADYAAHYRGFFATLGLDRFRLVGASMGGHFASTYAARNPAQIEKLSELVEAVYHQGRFVFICGNGGSGANASHFCEDLGKGTLRREDFENDRK